MSPTIKKLGIDRMTHDEQLALLGDIWDLLSASVRVPITDARRRELERRVAEDDANPDQGIPWEQVKADAIKRLKP